MTTISSSGQHVSPRDRLQSLLQSEVSSGQVSQTDATAISSALDRIDKALQADHPQGGKGGPQGGQPPGPPPGGASRVKDKVDSLIQKQVDAGSLTSDQDELKSLLDQARPDKSAAQDSATGSASDDTLKLLQNLLSGLQQDGSSYDAFGTGNKASSSPFVVDTSV